VSASLPWCSSSASVAGGGGGGGGGGGPELQLRLLELQDEVAELQRLLAEKDSELASRAQELLGLSASVLEKEKMLKSVGKSDALADTAVVRASQNVMNEELEDLRHQKCKVRLRTHSHIHTFTHMPTHCLASRLRFAARECCGVSEGSTQSPHTLRVTRSTAAS
jgi:hypothetical protein